MKTKKSDSPKLSDDQEIVVDTIEQDKNVDESAEALSGFAALGLSKTALKAIKAKGFEQPTKIQAEVIPLLLAGSRDVIAQSHTGTGKTAAFGLPLLDTLKPHAGRIQALVMVPTRELAVQVSEEVNSLKGSLPFLVSPFYGGQSYELQFRHLRQGVDIVVGTPGRIMDHLNRGSMDLSKLDYVVLDEADEMMDMGFIDDIETILASCNPDRHMLLFSATMPPRIRQIADTWMKDPEHITVKGSALTTSLTDQFYIEVREEDRFEALCRIIDNTNEFYGMVFCRTKVQSDAVYTRLLERGYAAEVLHGDVSQAMREKVLDAFRRRSSELLVATDVAARGIDVEGLTHVINYELPQDPESYVHRIGRTGRAGKSGTAITFISPREFRRLQFIQRLSKGEIRKEQLPKVEDIMAQKRNKLIREISDLMSSGFRDQKNSEFYTLARELLSIQQDNLVPEDIVAALIQHQLASWLDSTRYGEIRDLEPRREKRQRSAEFGPSSDQDTPRARLNIPLGKQDGLSKARLVHLINQTADVPERDLDDAEVLDQVSYITVDMNYMDKIVQAFADGNIHIRLQRTVKGRGRRPHERSNETRYRGDRDFRKSPNRRPRR